ncbi:MAG: ATP-binding protein [Candidatus Margulisbacteria bacterium]|nr:ATP-binding protein [Candidatus Margulisiibacteriota bacterium]
MFFDKIKNNFIKYLSNLSFFQKLFLLFASFFVIFFIVSFFLIDNSIQHAYFSKDIDVLDKHIRYIESTLNQVNKETLNRYAKNFGIRITLIVEDGTVIYDTSQNPLLMENHGKRPEVVAAKNGKLGINVHKSRTLRRTMLYAARQNGSLTVRTSLPVDNIKQQVNYAILRLLLIYILATGVILLMVFKLTKTMTDPLNKLLKTIENFSLEENISYKQSAGKDEIAMLTTSFNDLIGQIKQNLGKLRQLENVRKEFIANVTHELKTPLTAITGFIETLEAGALHDPEYNRRFLQIIKDNVERLTLLVNDILSLAKIESGRVDDEKINLTEILKELMEDLDLRTNKRIEFYTSHKKMEVLANRESIYSAFQNYIDNALKFCPEGKITISLTKEDQQAFFSVQDHGPGIAKKYLPRLFERFYRPDKTRSRNTGGTGLGLAIVKNTVEKYGGIAGVESIVGKGSRFYFSLPLV